MNILTPSGRRRKVARRAFTIAESVVSMLIVSVVLVAALNTIGAAGMGESTVLDSTRGLLLAQDLMAEILQTDFEEPDDPANLGRESGESGGSREDYDDVDDYDGWSSDPPEDAVETLISWATDYERKVNVTWLNPADPAQVSLVPTGMKQIEVIVSVRNQPVVTLYAIRTDAWTGPLDPGGF